MELVPDLRRRLHAAGVDPDDFGAPAEAWQRLYQSEGRRATLIDRYALAAAARGVTPEALSEQLRARLTVEVLKAHDPQWETVAGSGRARRDPIEVVDYDPAWPQRFADWRNRLFGRLGEVAVLIEHIGSTAVPGLAAKPVVDIQVSVADPDQEASYVSAIEGLGVALRSREGEGHRYFRPAGTSERTLQLHVCRAGSNWERTHLLFRDYLRAHPAARHAYASLKWGLARRFRHDRIAYNHGKTSSILDTMEEAEVWADRMGWSTPAGD